MFFTDDTTYLNHIGWLENGSAAVHRYLDIKNGIEDVVADQAQKYNHACGKIVITSTADTAELPEDFRDQLTQRFIDTFAIEIIASEISNAKTLENIASVIFQIYEQSRAKPGW
jgi:hypothetical protein